MFERNLRPNAAVKILAKKVLQTAQSAAPRIYKLLEVDDYIEFDDNFTNIITVVMLAYLEQLLYFHCDSKEAVIGVISFIEVLIADEDQIELVQALTAEVNSFIEEALSAVIETQEAVSADSYLGLATIDYLCRTYKKRRLSKAEMTADEYNNCIDIGQYLYPLRKEGIKCAKRLS